MYATTLNASVPDFNTHPCLLGNLPIHRSHEKSPEIVYYPDMVHGGGLLIWRSMFRKLWMHRELITHLIARDLSARYQQSLLGSVV